LSSFRSRQDGSSFFCSELSRVHEKILPVETSYLPAGFALFFCSWKEYRQKEHAVFLTYLGNSPHFFHHLPNVVKPDFRTLFSFVRFPQDPVGKTDPQTGIPADCPNP